MLKRLTVIGAGPIGLEAALYAQQLGFDVQVLERDQIAGNLRKWGHVRLFSPWEMNHSHLAVNLIQGHNSQWKAPASGAIMIGTEFAENYLEPISRLPELSGRIRTGISVVAIGRRGILKNEFPGSHERTSSPFRILTRDSHSLEQVHHADYLLDASGVFGNHNWLGEGGIPAPGEVAAEAHIDYELPDLRSRDIARFAGKRTLLVGAGYSAATTATEFQTLIEKNPATSLLWIVRNDRRAPIPVIEDDALACRASLTNAANAITETSQQGIEFRNCTTVTAATYQPDSDNFVVELECSGQSSQVVVDRIVANVGFGPDNSIYRELQVHECWATRGPMKLAAALMGASSGSTDCLAQGSMGADTLRNPEPNFFIIGNKSYGRNPTFLLRIGLSQIVEVFSLIMDDPELNLYERAREVAAV